jgi:hypothetical protein
MSTAINHQPRHHFGRQIAMVTAATVVAGGASAIGLSLSQNDATTPIAPSAPSLAASPECRASDCARKGRFGLGDFRPPNHEGHLTSSQGGHAMPGLL